jgi:branched-subunit amino acid transport protein AzlD
MMNINNVIISIFIMSGITFFTRAFPFIFFRKRNPPEIIIFIEKYIPPMVMLILVIYCLKDVKWYVLPFGIPEAVSVMVIVVLHLWRKNALISIFGGTILYMIMIQTGIASNLFK